MTPIDPPGATADIVDFRPMRTSGPADAPRPAQPFFFGAGVLEQDGERRVVEYCLLDVFATIALKFRAEWTTAWSGRGPWQPSADALAGLLMLRLAVARETVVIATRQAEDSLLPACAIGEARRVIEGRALYEDPALRQHAPAACARMARVHAEALEQDHTAFLVAARLHELWTIGEDALRAPAEGGAAGDVVPFPLHEPRSFAAGAGKDAAPLLSRLMGSFARKEGPLQ